jgi:hypothetical protein
MLGKFKTRFLFVCIFPREACSIHAGWKWRLKMLLGKGSGIDLGGARTGAYPFPCHL